MRPLRMLCRPRKRFLLAPCRALLTLCHAALFYAPQAKKRFLLGPGSGLADRRGQTAGPTSKFGLRCGFGGVGGRRILPERVPPRGTYCCCRCVRMKTCGRPILSWLGTIQHGAVFA